MKAEQFLKDKGILQEGFTKWVVKFSDGREFGVVNLLNEYAKAYHLEQSKDLIPLSEALEFAEEVPDNGWKQVSQGIWRNVMEANIPKDVRKTTSELYREFNSEQ